MRMETEITVLVKTDYETLKKELIKKWISRKRTIYNKWYIFSR